jgi:hypothetical protein
MGNIHAVLELGGSPQAIAAADGAVSKEIKLK